jgi:dTDP-4-dehydrorhamnose reductase
MRVAIIGAQGQLGQETAQAFTRNGDQVSALGHADIEVSDLDSVTSVLRTLKPELIVNTSAMHQVEKCEQNPTLAFAINAMGPRNIAMLAEELGAMIMHVSTDYVFDGEKQRPYVEEDAPRPLNTYGITKLAGEFYARSITARHYVLRTSAVYGKNPCRGKGGLNFVDLMLKMGAEQGKVRVVNTEEVTPTSTWDLAQQMLSLSRSECYGLFHATAEGSCTWYDFAREIFTCAKLPVSVEMANPGEFPAKVPRPIYSVLENAGLKTHRLNCFRPWQQGLHEYLEGQHTRVSTAEGNLLPDPVLGSRLVLRQPSSH